MTLEKIIELFESVERGEEGQMIGLHLHHAIRQANAQTWETNARHGHNFSDFLKALRDEEEERDIPERGAIEKAFRAGHSAGWGDIREDAAWRDYCNENWIKGTPKGYND